MNINFILFLCVRLILAHFISSMWSGSLKSDSKWDEHDMIVKRSSQGRQITSINLLNPVIQFKQLRWNVLKQLQRSEQTEEEEE